MKPISPQLGFNNNVRHKGRVFHIQTEDSGVKRPHIITHLFMDGGRILKSTKTSYAEFLDEAELAKKVRSMMQEQHKAMFIALRAGKFDHMFEPGAEAPAEGAAAAPASAPEAAASAPSSEAAAAAAAPTSEGSGPAAGSPSAAAPAPSLPPERDAAAQGGPASAVSAEDARFTRASLPSTTGVSIPPGDLPPAPEPPPPSAPSKSVSLRPPAPRPGSAPQLGGNLAAPPPPSGLRPPSRSRLEALGRDAPQDPPSARPVPEARPMPEARPVSRPDARPPMSASLDLDLQALERAAQLTGSPQTSKPRDLPPPPSAVRRPALQNTSYRSVTPQATHVATAPKSIPPRPPTGPQPAAQRGGQAPASAPSKYAASRPAAIFGPSKPQEGASIFGEDLISEKSLDEVILSYLAEDLEGGGKK